jgi:hypothetical protein
MDTNQRFTIIYHPRLGETVTLLQPVKDGAMRAECITETGKKLSLWVSQLVVYDCEMAQQARAALRLSGTN